MNNNKLQNWTVAGYLKINKEFGKKWLTKEQLQSVLEYSSSSSVYSLIARLNENNLVKKVRNGKRNNSKLYKLAGRIGKPRLDEFIEQKQKRINSIERILSRVSKYKIDKKKNESVVNLAVELKTSNLF
jgi:DNA-binding PadR family transcriptional regulator